MSNCADGLCIWYQETGNWKQETGNRKPETGNWKQARI